MEEALERYDVCVGLLKSQSRTSDGDKLTIHMPNLCVDSDISVEEVLYYTGNVVFMRVRIQCTHTHTNTIN